MSVDTDKAERVAKWRSALAIVLGSILIATQMQRMDESGGGPISWGITGLILAVFLIWASGLGRNKAFKGILNDESSEANKKRAFMLGFWNMLLTGVVCYGLSFIKDYGPRDAIQLMMTVGISSALFSFGVAERAFSYR